MTGLGVALSKFKMNFKVISNFESYDENKKKIWTGKEQVYFLKNNGPIPSSFCLFSSFSHYNFNNTNWKSVDSVVGIQTGGHKMVVADETTELWRTPGLTSFNYPIE